MPGSKRTRPAHQRRPAMTCPLADPRALEVSSINPTGGTMVTTADGLSPADNDPEHDQRLNITAAAAFLDVGVGTLRAHRANAGALKPHDRQRRAPTPSRATEHEDGDGRTGLCSLRSTSGAGLDQD